MSASKSKSGVFRAKTDAVGIVEIKASEDLSQLASLILVHPWIDFLLDRQPIGTITKPALKEDTNDRSSSIGGSLSTPGPSGTAWAVEQTRTSRLIARLALPFSARPRDAASLVSPSPVSPTDRRTQALQLLVRLRQPFGALLFTPTRQNIEEYRRVAAESLITVQVREDTPLDVLTSNARVLDVL